MVKIEDVVIEKDEDSTKYDVKVVISNKGLKAVKSSLDVAIISDKEEALDFYDSFMSQFPSEFYTALNWAGIDYYQPLYLDETLDTVLVETVNVDLAINDEIEINTQIIVPLTSDYIVFVFVDPFDKEKNELKERNNVTIRAVKRKKRPALIDDAIRVLDKNEFNGDFNTIDNSLEINQADRDLSQGSEQLMNLGGGRGPRGSRF